MGQYYYVVNIDKREYLPPHKFNDGLKLLEFGCSANGTMTALAILLADGNGRGGGDLCQTGKIKELGELRKHQCVVSAFDVDGNTYETRVPKIAGSWAGDRVVIAGDYADANFLPSGIPEKVTYSYENISGQKAIAKNISLNLYAWISMTKKQCKEAGIPYGDFKDVSEEALTAMFDDQYLRQDYENERDRSLRPDIIITAKDKAISSNKVRVEVNGGVAEVTQCPSEVEVEIIDHDNR